MGGIPAALNTQIYTLGAGTWLHTLPDIFLAVMGGDGGTAIPGLQLSPVKVTATLYPFPLQSHCFCIKVPLLIPH